MQIRLTWINTRRRKIIAIIIDFWISILLYNYVYFLDLNSYPNQVVTISIGSFWVIFSYILGRYKKEKSISLKSLLISILKVFSLIIFGVFIYAFIIFLFGKNIHLFKRIFKFSLVDKLILIFTLIVTIYALIPLGEADIFSKLIYAKNLYSGAC